MPFSGGVPNCASLRWIASHTLKIGEIDVNMQNFISMKGRELSEKQRNEERNMVHNLKM
jgi:hypothetical protein